MLSPLQNQTRTPSAQQAARAPINTPANAPQLVECDASLVLGKDGLAEANGNIRIDHAFLERLLKRVMRNPARFKDMQFRFDNKTGTFVATGNVKVMGAWIPMVARAKPLIDRNKPAFRFEEVRIPFSANQTGGITGGWLTAKVTKVVASAMQDDGLEVGFDPASGVIRMGANSILRKIDGLPTFVALDETKTRFAVAASGQGDLNVALTSARKGLPISHTPHSDISVTADDTAIFALLSGVLGEDCEVSAVHIRPGGLKVVGQVEYTPVSDTITGVKALVGLLRLGAGVGDMTPAKVMGPLDLDINISGSKLVIQPSLSQAKDKIAAALRGAGLNVEVREDGLHLDVASFLAAKGIRLEKPTLQAGLVQARLDVDIDGRIQSPTLKPPR